MPDNDPMQRLNLDGRSWRTEKDFYDALAAALGSFAGHGRNADVFEETMIYELHLNSVQPPYEVVIKHAPHDLLPFLRKFAAWITETRQDRRRDPDFGDDIEVVVTVA